MFQYSTKNMQHPPVSFAQRTDDTARLLKAVMRLKHARGNAEGEDNTASLPVISAKEVAALEAMVTQGSTILECCCYLAKYFRFNRERVESLKSAQLTLEIAESHALVNSIGWICETNLWTAENFVALTNSMIWSKCRIGDTLKLCFDIIETHIALVPVEGISVGVVTRIGEFLGEDGRFAVHVIEMFVDNAKRTNNRAVHIECVKIVAKIISEKEDDFIGFDFARIIEQTSDLVEAIEMGGLMLLSTICDVELKLEYTDLWRNAAVFVAKKFDELQRTDGFAEHEQRSISVPEELIDHQLVIETFKNFPGKRIPVPDDDFFVQAESRDVFNESQFEIFTWYRPLLHMRFKELIVVFLEEFAIHINSFETFLFFVSVVETVPGYRLSHNCCKIIGESMFLSSKWTLFSGGEFKVLNYLRNLLFQVMLKDNKEWLLSFIIEHTDDTMLFVENVIRICRIGDNVSSNMSEKMVMAIPRALHKLVISLSISFDEQVYRTWSTLFGFVMSLTENDAVNGLVFSSFEFTNTVLRHIYNAPVRGSVFAMLRKYLVTSKTKLGAIPQVCRSMLDTEASDDSEIYAVNIELVRCIEDAMRHNAKIVQGLSTIMSSILSFFLKFPNEDLMDCTLNFLMLVSFDCRNVTFGHTEMLELGRAISVMETGGLSENTMRFLWSLIAGSRNITRLFIIRNPVFVLLILNARSDNISEPVMRFYELCQHSVANCVQCHKSCLDLMLIQLIRSYPNPFTYMDCLFKHSFARDDVNTVIIPLLCLIFTYRASPQAIERFVGLTVPFVVEESIGHEEDEDELIIDRFDTKRDSKRSSGRRIVGVQSLDSARIYRTKKVYQSRREISLAYPPCRFGPFADRVLEEVMRLMNDKQEIYVTFEKGVKPTIFPLISCPRLAKGFTFSCYLMIDRAVATVSRAILFQLIDATGVVFRLYTNAESLLAEMIGPWGRISASLASELPSCEWMMITVAVRSMGPSLELEYILDKELVGEFTMRNPNFVGPTAAVQVGGFMDNDVPPNEASCFMGTYRFFDEHLDEAAITKMYCLGARHAQFGCNLLANATPVQGSYVISALHVFRSYDLARTILIPFFSFIDVAPPFHLERVVDLLKHSDCDRYFGLISQFLKQCDGRCITYSLYLRFFMLMTDRPSSELLKRILFDFGIWRSCHDPVHVLRIVNHWHQVLFQDFTDHLVGNTTFGRIVTEMCLFFWFSDSDADYHLQRSLSPVRGPANREFDLDIASIRNGLNRLLVKFAAEKLVDTDCESLVSHITTSHCVRHILSLLSLLSSIASMVSHAADYAVRLHPLFATDRFDVFMAALQAILLLVPGDAPQQIELILCHVGERHFRKDLLDALLDFGAQSPGTLVIACRIAVNMTATEQVLTAERFCETIEIQSPGELAKNSMWYIWPVVLLLRLPENLHDRFVAVICTTILANTRAINSVLGFMDVIALKCNCDVRTLQLKIVRWLADALDDHTNTFVRSIYRATRYLLFQFGNFPLSSLMNKAFIESPYFDGEVVDTLNNDANILGMDDITRLFDIEYTPLIFRAEVGDEGKKVFDELIEIVAGAYISEASMKKHVDFCAYLQLRGDMSQRDRFRALSTLSLSILNGNPVIETSFKRFFTGMKSKMGKYTSELVETASSLMNRTSEDMSEELSLIHEQWRSECLRATNDYADLCAEHMHDTSIWRSFAGESPELKRSFRVLDDCSAPLMSNRRKKRHVDIEIAVVKGKPLLTTQAKLTKSHVIQPVQFAVMTTGIVIAWRTKWIHIPIDSVRYILTRPSYAYEFVLLTGKTYFVDFPREMNSKVKHALKLVPFDPPPVMQTSESSFFIQCMNVTNDWMDRKITNFEYIMKINFFGGRSFSLSSGYPVFPLVRLSDGSLRDFNERLEVDCRVWLSMFSSFPSDDYEECSVSEPLEFATDDEMVDSSSIRNDDITDEEDVLSDYKDINVRKNVYEGHTFAQAFTSGSLELTPEFYSMPEAFATLDVHPSEYAFVYELRKLLESEYVSKNLHIWIDNVFGVKSGLKNPLFKGPHMPRRPIADMERREVASFSVVEGSVSYVAIESASADRIVVYTISDDKVVRKTTIHIDKANFVRNELGFEQRLEKDGCFGFIESGILVLNRVFSEICYFGGNDRAIVSTMQFPTDCCSDNGVCWSADGVVCSIAIEKESIDTFGVCSVSPATPSCACSSVRHRVTAVGVRSGKVLVYDRVTGMYLRAIAKCEGEPKRILICEKFQFVVVQYRDFLRVYSVYGSLIAEKKIAFEVAVMVTGVASDGLDHIFVADTTGRVISMEVFTLDLKEHARCEGAIIAMTYVNALGCIFACTNEGNGLLIPYNG